MPLILEAGRLFEQTSIKTQVLIAQQLLLQKRAQLSSSKALLLQHIRPRLQDLIIQIINHTLQIQLRELGDQRTLETGLDAEDFVREPRDRTLTRIPMVNDIEHRRLARRRLLVRYCALAAHPAQQRRPSLPLPSFGSIRETVMYFSPLGRLHDGPHHIPDPHAIDAQVLGPQPLQLAPLLLVHARETQELAREAGVVLAIDMRESQHHNVQAWYPREGGLGVEFCASEPEPRLQCGAFGRGFAIG